MNILKENWVKPWFQHLLMVLHEIRMEVQKVKLQLRFQKRKVAIGVTTHTTII
jgi:hypothetical protein